MKIKFYQLLTLVSIASFSLESICSVYEESDGYELVLDAIINNDLGQLERVLSKNQINHHYQNYEFQTPLHLAIERGKMEMVKLLLERCYAAPCALDLYCKTPLHVAAEKDAPQIVSALLKYLDTQHVNMQDIYGNTPLHYAALRGNYRIIALLRAKGADEFIANLDGDTAQSLLALHSQPAFAQPQLRVRPEDDYRRLKKALDNAIKANDSLVLCHIVALITSAEIINQRDSSTGLAFLHTAVLCNKPEIVQALIQAGAQVDKRDAQKRTPLHRAAEQGSLEIIQLLLSKGADMHAKDQEGNTPLHTAIINKCFKVIQHLLNNNADSSVLNNNDESPVTLIACYSTDELTKLLENLAPQRKAYTLILGIVNKRSTIKPQPIQEYTRKDLLAALNLPEDSTPYQILGIAMSADKDQIGSAYKKMMAKWHPDRNSDPRATEVVKVIGAAKDELL
jgi:ankyrin repeat protein